MNMGGGGGLRLVTGGSHKAQLQLSLPLSPKARASTAWGQCHQPAASGKDSLHSTNYREERKKYGPVGALCSSPSQHSLGALF